MKQNHILRWGLISSAGFMCWVAFAPPAAAQGMDIFSGRALKPDTSPTAKLDVQRLEWARRDAQQMLDEGNCRAAVMVCKSALEQASDPLRNSSEVNPLRRVLAEAYLRQHQGTLALPLLTDLYLAGQGTSPVRGIKLWENGTVLDSKTAARIGLALAQAGRYEESRRWWTPQFVLQHATGKGTAEGIPQPRTARELEGLWLLALGIEQDAWPAGRWYYDQARALIPSSALLNLQLGKLYLRKNEFKLAADCFVIAEKEGKFQVKSEAAALKPSQPGTAPLAKKG